jgi:hypothetical protein
MNEKTQPRTKKPTKTNKRRVLIVFDGEKWYIRNVALIEHDLSRNFKVYHCDKHLGGGYATLDKAVAVTKSLI